MAPASETVVARQRVACGELAEVLRAGRIKFRRDWVTRSWDATASAKATAATPSVEFGEPEMEAEESEYLRHFCTAAWEASEGEGDLADDVKLANEAAGLVGKLSFETAMAWLALKSKVRAELGDVKDLLERYIAALKREAGKSTTDNNNADAASALLSERSARMHEFLCLEVLPAMQLWDMAEASLSASHAKENLLRDEDQAVLMRELQRRRHRALAPVPPAAAAAPPPTSTSTSASSTAPAAPAASSASPQQPPQQQQQQQQQQRPQPSPLSDPNADAVRAAALGAASIFLLSVLVLERKRLASSVANAVAGLGNAVFGAS